jgi:hypothetical protein
MFWILLLSVFCVGLLLFFYHVKGSKESVPDYSYIIFKDYTTDTIGTDSSCSTKAEEAAKEVAKEENLDKELDKEQEETPIATLDFED